MKNVFSAKIAIDAEICFLENRMKTCLHIKEELEKLTLNEGVETVGCLSENTNNDTLKINPEQFADYPFNKRLFEKLDYLDKKNPKAWMMRDRLELIVQIEGESVRSRLEKYMSNDLKNMVKMGFYVGAKYNNENKFQFYVRPEWVNDDGKSIKSEYAPTSEDFGTMPESKRKNESIVWIADKK